MLALANGIPKVMNLKEMLEHFLDFRRIVIVRRTKFELGEAEDRAHILEGLKVALENIDEVISIIRGSKNPEEAKSLLIEKFKFSDKQTKAILDMRLQRLTSMEVDRVVEEYNELQILIKKLNDILESHNLQSDIIREELLEINDKYGDERRSEIIPISGDLSIEDMIADEDMVVTITHNGYIKRLPATTWKTQRRGGRGMKGAKTQKKMITLNIFLLLLHTVQCYFLQIEENVIG